MKRYYYKACPKCHGDLVLQQDIHGWFVQCVQCSMLREVPDPLKRARMQEQAAEPVAAGRDKRAA